METLALLKKLVSIPSPFPKEQEVGKYINDYLVNLGFRIQKVRTGKNRINIVATYGKSASYLGFYGHMDTIAPDADYPQDPYKMMVTNNKARGLGVADMKGGITAILKLGEYAVVNKLPVKLIFGVDEENISEGAHNLVDSGYLNDIGFLIVGESGQAASVKQSYNVCYGRKGRILYEIVVRGKKAHAAEAERGINAVAKGAEVVTLLNRLRFAPHKRLGKTRVVIHSMHSETDSFSIPDTCIIRFSLLTTPNVKSSDVATIIKQQAKTKNISLTITPVTRPTPYGESYEVDTKHDFLKQLEREMFKPDGIKPMYTTSVADENVFANRLHIPVITLGPIGGGDHTIHEWLDLHSLDAVIQAYQRTLHLYTTCTTEMRML